MQLKDQLTGELNRAAAAQESLATDRSALNARMDAFNADKDAFNKWKQETKDALLQQQKVGFGHAAEGCHQ
jgi:hypothetical protein